MASTQALQTQDAKFDSLRLSKSVVNEEKVTCYSRGFDSVSDKNPIIVLIHGYPQSSYMWRHLIPLLPSTSPLFVPDLPGYGATPPIPTNDKLHAGNAILYALKSLSGTSSTLPVIIIGHDRGARVAHRLAVSGHDGVSIQGVCLIDIVPTSTQWHHSSSPVKTAKEVTGYFHWPLLANVDLATRMITAYGGGNWCSEMIERWAGRNPSGVSSLKSDSALAVYSGFFESESVIRASCEDYKHGATTDLEEQEQEQKDGRKIKCPLLLIYSSDYIGKRFDFSSVWKDWVDEGVKIVNYGLGNGIGHFGAEEAPEECAKVLGTWMGALGEAGVGDGAARL